jgi:hypothetical protein
VQSNFFWRKLHMKIKRIFGTVVALAAASALALSVAATATVNTKDRADNNFVRVSFIGNDVAEAKAIHPDAIDSIKSLKVSLVKQTATCSSLGDDDDPCDTSKDQHCASVVTMMTGNDWKQTNFCLAEKDSITLDIDLPEESYFAVQVATWPPSDMDGEFKVEVLDKDGKVIALNTAPAGGGGGSTTETPANPPAGGGGGSGTGGAGTGGSGTGGAGAGATKTGLPGIAVLGGVAILATGAIVISRRRG